MSIRHDRTAVTGTPSATRPPQRGDVIGERYEIRGKLRDDAFSLGFLAFDQELESSVLLRMIRGEVLDESMEDEVVEKLRASVGTGGKFLPGLLDADRDTEREGARVFAIEPVPEGACLRDVLDRRIASKKPLSPDELTPVIAHLDAALRAIPEGWRHGDLRPDNVWVDELRLQLTGAFVVPALPEGVVAAVLQRNRGLRTRSAPEQVLGQAEPASDLFGVGMLAFESLALRTPGVDEERTFGSTRGIAEPVRESVEALLRSEPGDRPTTLTLLLDALAFSSGLPVPELEPGEFRHRRRRTRVRGTVPPPVLRPNKARTVPPRVAKDDATRVTPSVAVSKDDATTVSPSPSLPSREPRPTSRPPPRLKPAVDEPATPAVGSPLAQIDRAGRASLQEARAVAASRPSEHPGLLDASTAVDSIPPAAPPEDSSDAPQAPKVSEDGRTQLIARRIEAVEEDPANPTLPSHAIDRKQAEGILQAARARAAQRRELSEAERRTRAKAAGLDPRLVRAALADDEDGSHHVEAADTRTPSGLLLADDFSSEGVPLDPAEVVRPTADGTQEIGLDELEMEVPLDPSEPATARPDGTQEIGLDELEMEGADPDPAEWTSDEIAIGEPVPTKDGRRALGLAHLQSMKRQAGLVETQEKPLPDDSVLSQQLVERAPPPYVSPSLLSDVPPVNEEREWDDDEAMTAPAAPRLRPPPARPRARPRESGQGRWIIVLAMFLGIAIIGASFAYAKSRRDQAEELRQQRLQERFDRLQGGEAPPVDMSASMR